MEEWSTREIVTAIIATGFLSALFSNLFGGLRDAIGGWRRNRKIAAYMAMRLANSLETYASACSELIDRNNNAQHRHDEQFPDWDARLPKVESYPDDPDGWKAINRHLADRCLRLPNRSAAKQSMIYSTAEFAEDRIETEVKIYAAELGSSALDLAQDLRRSHGLEPLAPEWDVHAFLKKMQKAGEDQQEAQRMENRGLTAQFAAFAAAQEKQR